MKTLLFSALFFIAFPILAQEEDKELYQNSEEPEIQIIPKKPNEIGVDVAFSATTMGGTVGTGIKYGIVKNENFIFGPSIRLQKSWYNYMGVKSSWAIYGGGVFAHYRFYNYLFAGAEFELLSTPFKNGYLTMQRSIAPTLLIGGGFSRAFSENFRLNAGVMYDAINSTNSPFRQGYFMHKSNGALIPVIYRIAFFFPI
jgi:hypothetical protein